MLPEGFFLDPNQLEEDNRAAIEVAKRSVRRLPGWVRDVLWLSPDKIRALEEFGMIQEMIKREKELKKFTK